MKSLKTANHCKRKSYKSGVSLCSSWWCPNNMLVEADASLYEALFNLSLSITKIHKLCPLITYKESPFSRESLFSSIILNKADHNSQHVQSDYEQTFFKTDKSFVMPKQSCCKRFL